MLHIIGPVELHKSLCIGNNENKIQLMFLYKSQSAVKSIKSVLNKLSNILRKEGNSAGFKTQSALRYIRFYLHVTLFSLPTSFLQGKYSLFYHVSLAKHLT